MKAEKTGKLTAASSSTQALAEALKVNLDYEELTNCMRCGFCQPACPTYTETGIEAASPRGRIALMKAVADGLMEPDQAFKDQLDLCLGCRACEPVCPSDVKYGHLLEQARATIEQHTEHPRHVKLARNVMFKHVFPKQQRMKLVGLGLKLYQKTGLQWAARKSGMLKLFPESMRQMEAILPEAQSDGVVEQLGTFYPAENGQAVAKVGMFRGCIMDVLFTETNIRTVKLLAASGFDVILPPAQNCCGALHAHSGEMETAKELAKRNIRAFQEANVDYIVSNAGGCGALLMEYDHLLQDDEEWAEHGKWFAERVLDISELIVTKGQLPVFRDVSVERESLDKAKLPSEQLKGATKFTGVGTKQRPEDVPVAAAADGKPKVVVTYQDSCHLRNVMRGGSAPRALMKSVENIQFTELRNADKCCGSAGIYNILQPEMATQILDHKMEDVKQTNAHYLITSNPGCLLQMKLGIERENLGNTMKALHIVDFLYERLQKEDKL
ncbi:(Fe-S)-binding protein [Paenibacillus senegalensis]|uniref:(Fe-S)-binding protein n=1 Tax=Paenibacillus senegalensis TaxID=1465766 RepID=UPI00028993F7